MAFIYLKSIHLAVSQRIAYIRVPFSTNKPKESSMNIRVNWIVCTSVHNTVVSAGMYVSFTAVPRLSIPLVFLARVS